MTTLPRPKLLKELWESATHCLITFAANDTSYADLSLNMVPASEKVSRVGTLCWADTPPDIHAAYKLVVIQIEEHKSNLILPILRHIEDGHWNNAIREKLSALCGIEGWTDLKPRIDELPDREFCGTVEGWCLCALSLYAKVMWACYDEKIKLTKQALEFVNRSRSS